MYNIIGLSRIKSHTNLGVNFAGVGKKLYKILIINKI